MSENQTPLKQPTWREKLRDKITTLRRHIVIGKHKLHKKQQVGKRASVRWLRALPIYRRLGAFLYQLGFQTEYSVVRTGRLLRDGAYTLCYWFLCLVDLVKKIFGRFGHMVWDEFLRAPVVFVRGLCRISVNTVQVARSNGIGYALKLCGSNLKNGVRLYGKLVPRTLAYVVPVVTGLLCWEFVQGQLGQNFALDVQVKGTDVGYVASESVFETAKTSVNERINYAGSEHTDWDITPHYMVAAVPDQQELMTETAMADAILQTSDDEIQEGTALYIDGELRRVTTDGKMLKAHIDQMKAPFLSDDPAVTVGFNHEVELEDGIYFNDSFNEISEVMNYLSSDEVKQESYTVVAGDSISLIATKNGLTQAELYELNPGLTATSNLFPGDQLIVQKQETVLEIRVRKEVTYTEPIAFVVHETKSDQYDYGTTKTVTEGQNGEREITAVQTFDPYGNILSTEVISNKVLKEPVNKEVVHGTRLPSGTVGKLGSGTLMWPVPNYRYCNRWYTGKHKGVDINASVGTPIYAADNGRVVKAGLERAGAGSGYGISLIIDHGNGVTTLYAHCSNLYVSAGQSVSQGQHIANVGMTGRTSGPHLHFEIRRNGNIVPPQDVFPNKRR